MYMFLFYADEKAIASMDREERNGLVERHVAYNHEVLETRVRVAETRGLEPTTSAMTVRPSGGEMVVVPGPFARTPEALAGFYLVDCDGLDEALELAKLYPMPDGLGCVEVRPVLRTWDYAPSVDSPAPPSAIWRYCSDVKTWPTWKAGVEQAELHGPFVAGATGRLVMTEYGQVPLRIVDASPDDGYAWETELDDSVLIRMEQRLTQLPDGGTRITHRATVPRAALDRFGLRFSPNLNAGMRATLRALSDLAAPVGDEPEAAAPTIA